MVKVGSAFSLVWVQPHSATFVGQGTVTCGEVRLMIGHVRRDAGTCEPLFSSANISRMIRLLVQNHMSDNDVPL
jgi:hypothetical protein